MSKIKFLYSSEEEKNQLIKALGDKYIIKKISKENIKGPHRRIYIDLEYKYLAQ